MSNNDYQLPDVGLLSVPPHRENETVAENSRKRDIIARTLREFGIAGEVTGHSVGPRVARFEITPAPKPPSAMAWSGQNSPSLSAM